MGLIWSSLDPRKSLDSGSGLSPIIMRSKSLALWKTKQESDKISRARLDTSVIRPLRVTSGINLRDPMGETDGLALRSMTKVPPEYVLISEPW